MATNLALASIRSTGSTTNRTLGARFAEVINVKDYNAKGDNSTDDTASIQAAFDAAFKTGGVANATANRFLNRSVFFPAGRYKITGSGLNLTDIDGGYIFGSGASTELFISGATGISLFNINGMINSRIERFNIQGGSSNTGIDLNWDNAGVGLGGNFFSDLNCVALLGWRVANNGFGGANNVWYNCTLGGVVGSTGLKIVGANAIGNSYFSGGGNTLAIGIHVVDGQMASIIGTSWGINVTTADIKIDNSSHCAIHGGRSESPNILQSGTARVHLAGFAGAGATGFMVNMTSPGVALIDACDFPGGSSRKTILGSGTLYLRGNRYQDGSNTTVLAGWSGTKPQDY